MKSTKLYEGLVIIIPHFNNGKGTYTFHYNHDTELYTMTWSESKGFEEKHSESTITALIKRNDWIPVTNLNIPTYEIY